MKRLDPGDATFLAFVAANPKTPPAILKQFRKQVSADTWRIAQTLVAPKPSRPPKRSRNGLSKTVDALRRWAISNTELSSRSR